MIVQFGICPMGVTHMSGDIKEVTRILAESGLEYQVGPMSTCIEGDWQTVLATIEKCHKTISDQHERVITTITIDDHGAAQHSLRGAVKAVEVAGDSPPVETDATRPAVDA